MESDLDATLAELKRSRSRDGCSEGQPDMRFLRDAEAIQDPVGSEFGMTARRNWVCRECRLHAGTAGGQECSRQRCGHDGQVAAIS